MPPFSRDARRRISFAYALSDARLLAIAAPWPGARARRPPIRGVLADLDRRQAEQDKAARDAVAQRGCRDPQIIDLIGVADRASN